MALDPTNWSDVHQFQHDPTQVPGDLPHAKLVMRLTTEDLSTAQASGDDFRVTDSSDNVLDYEIEEFDQAGDVLVVWFRVPNLSSTSAQEFRVYWGNPGAANAENPAGLWGTGPEEYQEVLHFPVGNPAQASLGSNPSVATGDGAPSGISSPLGGAVSFDGAETYEVGPDTVHSSFCPGCGGLEQPFTVELWVRLDSLTSQLGFFSRRYGSALDAAAEHAYVQFRGHSDQKIQAAVTTRRPPSSSTPLETVAVVGSTIPSTGQWIHVVVVFTSQGKMELWIDGVEDDESSPHDTQSPDYGQENDASAQRPPLLGNLWTETGGDQGFLEGDLDEVRWGYKDLSADRIKVSYNNQSQTEMGAGFWSTGGLNNPPAKPTLAVDESRETGAALSSSAFSDPDGDAHDASRWQVDEAGGDFSSPVHDSGWTMLNLESYDTGDGVYPSGADYIARVAHRDPSGEFTWSDPVAFTAPALAQLSSVEGLFFGQSGGNNLWQFGGAHLDLSSPITCRMRTAPVGPGGVGGEALFHNLYLALEWQSEGTVEVIPIVDGDRRTDLSRTINLAQKAEPTRDRFEIPLVYGFEDGGVEVLRQALRGTWFQAELLVTLSRPSVHGIMVEGVELEQELVRESHPAVSYTIESLDDVDHEQAVPWYVGAGGELLEGDTGVTDDGAGITARIQTPEVAPAGPGGEAAFHNVYLALTRSNPLDATLTLTPIVDGVDQNARNLTLAGVAGPLTEVLEVPLTQGFDVGGVEELRHALRGAFFSLHLEAGVPDGALVFEGLELETEIVREGEAAVAG